MSLFKHTVTLPFDKNKYDRMMFNNSSNQHRQMVWLYENIGISDLGGIDTGLWSFDIKYDPEFAVNYSFKNEKDAMLFALVATTL